MSVFYNIYNYSYLNNKKNINEIYSIDNKGYFIKNSSLFIDYPEFIKNSDNYTKQILSRFDGFNAEKIIIENINGDDFIFLSNITSKIYFRYYDFDFRKYSDDLNQIFDSINRSSGPVSIGITFNTKLEGKNTLLNTFEKIDSVINEIVYNNSIINKNNNTIESFSIHGYDSFLENYNLSKSELDIISNMKIKNFVHRINMDKNDFTDEYIINYLKNIEIINFSHFFNYIKNNGKIYKVHENQEWELIQ